MIFPKGVNCRTKILQDTETNPLSDAIRRTTFIQCCFGYMMHSENLIGNPHTSHCHVKSHIADWQLFSLLSWGKKGMVRCGPFVGYYHQIKCRLLKKRFDYNDFKGHSGVGVNSTINDIPFLVWENMLTVKNSCSMMIICVSVLSVCVFAVMLHGLPISKVKRESSPSKELSPCRKLQADMCLYSYRYKNQCFKTSAWYIRHNRIMFETVNTETWHFLLVSSPQCLWHQASWA